MMIDLDTTFDIGSDLFKVDAEPIIQKGHSFANVIFSKRDPWEGFHRNATWDREDRRTFKVGGSVEGRIEISWGGEDGTKVSGSVKGDIHDDNGNYVSGEVSGDNDGNGDVAIAAGHKEEQEK